MKYATLILQVFFKRLSAKIVILMWKYNFYNINLYWFNFNNILGSKFRWVTRNKHEEFSSLHAAKSDIVATHETPLC